MARFTFEGSDPSGQRVVGEVDAETQASAVEQAAKQGVSVRSVRSLEVRSPSVIDPAAPPMTNGTSSAGKPMAPEPKARGQFRPGVMFGTAALLLIGGFLVGVFGFLFWMGESLAAARSGEPDPSFDIALGGLWSFVAGVVIWTTADWMQCVDANLRRLEISLNRKD